MHPLQKKLLECMVASDRSGFYAAVDRIMGIFGDELLQGEIFSHNRPEDTNIHQLDTHKPANWFNERMWRSNRYLRIHGRRLYFDFERTDKNGLRMICIIRAHRRPLEAEGFTFEEIRMGTRGKIEVVVQPKERPAQTKAVKRRNAMLMAVAVAAVGIIFAMGASVLDTMILGILGILLCVPSIILGILYLFYPIDGKKKKKKGSKHVGTARKH